MCCFRLILGFALNQSVPNIFIYLSMARTNFTKVSWVGKFVFALRKQNNINKGKLVETWLMAWNGRLISETMSSLRERLLPHHPNNGKGLITDTFQFYLSLSLKKSICLALAMLLFKWELFSSRYNGNCSSIDVISFFISELCLAYWYL